MTIFVGFPNIALSNHAYSCSLFSIYISTHKSVRVNIEKKIKKKLQILTFVYISVKIKNNVFLESASKFEKFYIFEHFPNITLSNQVIHVLHFHCIHLRIKVL